MNRIIIFVVLTAAALLIFLGVKITLKFRQIFLLGVTIPVASFYVLLAVLWQPDNLFLSNSIVLITAVLAGSSLGLLLSSEPSVISFSIAAAAVDIFSFSGGVTKNIITSYQSGESLLLRFLTISVPVQGNIVPVVGIGDLFILGGIYFSLKKLNYSDWESILVPLSGLLLALIIGLLIGGVFSIPFIALTVTIYVVYRRRRNRGRNSVN